MTRKSKWLLGAVALAASGGFVLAVAENAMRNWWHMSGWTLTALLALLAFYGKRFSLTRASDWLMLHLHAGWITFVLFIAHSGSPGDGFFGGMLWAVAFVAMASGALGFLLMRATSRRIAEWEPLPRARINELRAKAAANAEQVFHDIMEESPNYLLPPFYAERLLPFFAEPRYMMQHWTGSEHAFHDLLAGLDRCASSEENDNWRRMRELIEEKHLLDKRLALFWLQRGWLFVHVPAAAALTVLVAAHILAVYAFGG